QQVYGTKQRQERPYRRKVKAFQADNKDKGHDPSWPAPIGVAFSTDSGSYKTIPQDKNDTLGFMAGGVEARVKKYGRRTLGGRHNRRRDWSDVINAEIASHFFKK